MKRKVIAVLLALAFVCCSAMSILTVFGMERAWGASATCSIGSLTSRDLSILTALYPDLGWTAYVQSAPQQIACNAPPVRTAEAAVMSFLGAPDRIAFFPLVSGRLPLDGERGACALDKDTVFRLFGSLDPGEVLVRLDGEPVRVVGVMDVDSPLVFVPAAQADVLERLGADDRDALLTLANVLGIELDSFDLSGAESSKILGLLCAVPWLLAAILALVSLRKQGGWRRIASTVLLCVLSLSALLAVLWCVPVRLLPARWSDLAFYGEQMAAWKARPFRAPDVRDELLKSDILRMGFWSAAACIALWMERMWLKCGKSR